MPRILIVHHTPSPAMHALLDSATAGARESGVEDLDVLVRPALAATASDVLDSDGYVLGTPANLGYMSGALKHFFDTIYYPCLDATVGKPLSVYIHGNSDTDGARLGIEKIVTGLRWKLVAEVLQIVGDPGKDDLGACWELGAVTAATLDA